MIVASDLDILGSLPEDLHRPAEPEDLLSICGDLLDVFEPAGVVLSVEETPGNRADSGVQFIQDEFVAPTPCLANASGTTRGNGLGARIGVAIPMGQQVNGPGIASVDGDEAFSYSSLDDLSLQSPSVTFVLAKNSIGDDEALVAFKWLRGAGYFATSLEELAVELGFKINDLEGDDASACVAALSEIASRSTQLLNKIVPSNNHKGTSKSIRETLISSVASYPGLKSDVNAEVMQAAEALRRAPIIFCNSSRIRDVNLRLRISRFEHLVSLSSKFVPDDSWIEVPSTDFHLDKWLDDEASPVMVKVSIRPHRDGSPLLFGDKDQRKIMHVAWVSAHEMKTLMPYVSLRVNRMFASTGKLTAANALGIGDVVQNPFWHSSLSAGLVAESLVHAMCSDYALHSDDTHAIRANWLCSISRTICLKEAIPLTTIGISIKDVGPTHVDVSLPKYKLPALRSYLLDNCKLRMPIIRESDYE